MTKGYVDIVEALKFDRATVLKRIEMIRGFLKAAGRAPDALELSGGGFVLMAKDRAHGRRDGGRDGADAQN